MYKCGGFMCDLLSVSKRTIIENIENDNFFRRFGNPVKFEDGTSVILTKEEEEKLKREHIDENVYCLPYKYLSADIYGTVIDELLKDTFTIVNDELINRAIELVGCRYSSKCDLEEVDSVFDYIEDETMDIMMDYESDMDGKLLVSLIIGKYIDTRVNGIAVAEYD